MQRTETRWERNMGKVKQFNIFFRDSQAVYEAGRIVHGYVKLDLAEKSTIDSEFRAECSLPLTLTHFFMNADCYFEWENREACINLHFWKKSRGFAKFKTFDEENGVVSNLPPPFLLFEPSASIPRQNKNQSARLKAPKLMAVQSNYLALFLQPSGSTFWATAKWSGPFPRATMRKFTAARKCTSTRRCISSRTAAKTFSPGCTSLSSVCRCQTLCPHPLKEITDPSGTFVRYDALALSFFMFSWYSCTVLLCLYKAFISKHNTAVQTNLRMDFFLCGIVPALVWFWLKLECVFVGILFFPCNRICVPTWWNLSSFSIFFLHIFKGLYGAALETRQTRHACIHCHTAPWLERLAS